MILTIKNRWQAASIHLCASLCVLMLVGLLATLCWYPLELRAAHGGIQLFWVIAGVDAVLGPLLTCIVYAPQKKSLKFDLAVIVALQLSALAYGCNTLFQGRPVYLVFAVDRYELVTANQILLAEQEKATNAEFKRLPLVGVDLIGVTPPRDAQERLRILGSALNGSDLQSFPQYYVPYAEVASKAAHAAKPIETFLAKYPELHGDAQSLMNGRRVTQAETGYLPLRGRAADMCVMVDKRNGNVIGYLAADPWGDEK